MIAKYISCFALSLVLAISTEKVSIHNNARDMINFSNRIV